MHTQLSPRDARRLALQSTGLLRHNQFGRGRNALLRAVEQLSYVQIDTISVVERAHHHTCWTRVDNYTPTMLDQLQVQHKKIFEYWFHAASYLPMSRYRFFQPLMRSITGNYSKAKRDLKMQKYVLDRIQAEGPLQSRDFEDPDHRSSGWWNWKPAKIAMERLFMSGELMVVRRDGFQKVYDLTERVLPADLDLTLPDEEEWNRFLIGRMLTALGLGRDSDLAYIRYGTGKIFAGSILASVRRTLKDMLEEGSVIQVRVGDNKYYTTREHLENLVKRVGKKVTRLLSPFDNLIIQRRRTLDLFDFDYQLECYVPQQKRKYGYFSLPVLWGDRLVGRLDAKAIRKTHEFQIKNLVLEESPGNYQELAEDLSAEIGRFAVFNGCDRITLERIEPVHLKPMLQTRSDRYFHLSQTASE
jgi:uncharacterized protein YcaQ